jgi:hypothetical protein
LASGNSAASRARMSGATVANIPVRVCHIGEGHQIFSQSAPRHASSRDLDQLRQLAGRVAASCLSEPLGTKDCRSRL